MGTDVRASLVIRFGLGALLALSLLAAGTQPAAAGEPNRERIVVGTAQFGPDLMQSLSVLASEVEGFPSTARYTSSPTAEPLDITLDCVFIAWQIRGTRVAHLLYGSGIGDDSVRYYVTAGDNNFVRTDAISPVGRYHTAKVTTTLETETGSICGTSPRFQSAAYGLYVFAP